MTTNTLKAAALVWLRFTCRCFLVMTERGPRWMDNPDVLGVMTNRKCIEVEVKVSMSDFRANRHKRIIQYREKDWACDYPAKFYFAVPPEMVCAVEAELPPYAGLVTVDGTDRWGNPAIKVVRGAKTDPRACKLSVQQIARLVVKQSNTLCRYAVKCANHN